MSLILYNPTNKDFCTTYDINGDGNPIQYCVKARDTAEFKGELGYHMLKHLSRFIMIDRDVKTNWDDDIKAVEKEIIVEV